LNSFGLRVCTEYSRQVALAIVLLRPRADGELAA
jgi:hypothetical protein